MLVRRSKSSDLEAVITLGQRAHAESVWADEEYSMERAENTFHMIHEHANSIILLLCKDETVVGILVASLQLSYFSLDYDAVESLFYIDPEHRTPAAVRALVTAYEQWAQTMGASAVHLSTSQLKDAERVTAMYGKLGYGISAFVHRKALT